MTVLEGHVQVHAGYNDWFRGHSVGAVHYGLEVNAWFTSKVGGFVNVNRSEFTNDAGSAWRYRTGVRLKF